MKIADYKYRALFAKLAKFCTHPVLTCALCSGVADVNEYLSQPNPLYVFRLRAITESDKLVLIDHEMVCWDFYPSTLERREHRLDKDTLAMHNVDLKIFGRMRGSEAQSF